MKSGRSTILPIGILAVLVAIFVLFVDTVPPRSMTHTNMHMTKRRILRYATAHDSLPTALDQLPRIEGYVNDVTDGWGRPILWRIEGNQITLISFGRDGMPGGIGEDADMAGVFQAKTTAGRWEDEFCKWLEDPFREL